MFFLIVPRNLGAEFVRAPITLFCKRTVRQTSTTDLGCF